MFSTISSLSIRPLRYGPKQQRGNALFIVLLGVVLFGALSFSLMRQESGGSATSQLTDDQAELYATQFINHTISVKQAIALMLDTGSTIGDIDFVRPGEAGYDTSPHIHKVYHPGGAGITPFRETGEHYAESDNVNNGLNYKKATNVLWTPTTQHDLIYSLRGMSEQTCAAINRKIIGTSTIPQTTVGFNQLFNSENPTNTYLDATICSDCEGYAKLCVANLSGLSYLFYNIAIAR
jgi:hypothetical protein